MKPILNQTVPPTTNVQTGTFVQLANGDVVAVMALRGKAAAMSLKYAHRIMGSIKHPGMKVPYSFDEVKTIFSEKLMQGAIIITADKVPQTLAGVKCIGTPLTNDVEASNVSTGSLVLHGPTMELFLVVLDEAVGAVYLLNMDGRSVYNVASGIAMRDGMYTNGFCQRLFRGNTSEFTVLESTDQVSVKEARPIVDQPNA